MLRPSAIKLLERFHNAAKKFRFRYGLARSALKRSESSDFDTLYQQGYIFSKGIRGQRIYFPTQKGIQLLAEQGQTLLFPEDGYFYFYHDPTYTKPYLFEKNGKQVHAKARTLEAAMAFKERARARGIDVFFKKSLISERRNPDLNLRDAERAFLAGDTDDLHGQYNSARMRAGLPLHHRQFSTSQGWVFRTTLPDGRRVSSAAQMHDGWWGVGHVLWTGDFSDEMIELGEHYTVSSRLAPHIPFLELPRPTRELVERLHEEVLEDILNTSRVGRRVWQTPEQRLELQRQIMREFNLPLGDLEE